MWRIGSAAWLLDESAIAVRLLQDAMARLRAPGTQGASGGGLTALGWLYVDTGRWDKRSKRRRKRPTGPSQPRWASWPRPRT